MFTPGGLTLWFVYLRLLHTHRHYPHQVLTIFLGVEPTREGVEFGVGHVPPEFDLLLVHRREKLGIRAAHDRIDTLEVLVPFLVPGVSERVASRHAVVNHVCVSS